MKHFLLIVFMALAIPMVAFGQASGTRVVRGTVVDENDEPLIGATVRLTDSKSGTSTDVDGKFALPVPVGKTAKITVSYVGYTPRTVEVPADKNDIDIDLSVNAADFDEVVVIGYSTAKRTGLTASVEVIKGDELLKSTAMNIDQSLAGKVTGLGVLNSNGNPSSGKEASLSIRGNSGDPLLVIDGVPRLGTTTNDGEMRLSDLNPEDIESISVLKDAAASAVYGARAANGVILVQTKRGNSEGRTRVNYRGQFNFEEATYLPKFLNSYEFAKLYNKAVEATGSDVYTPYDLDLIGSDPNLYGDENILDHLNKWGYSQRHSLSVSGGVKSVRYYVSLGYTNTRGLYSNVGRNRYNYSLKLDADLYRGLDLAVNVIGSISDYKNTGSSVISDAYDYSPLEVLRFTDGNLSSLESYNPLIAIEGLGGYEKVKSDFHTINATLTYTFPFIEGLKVYLKGTVDMNHKNTTEFSKPVRLFIYDPITKTTSVDENTVYPKADITMSDRHQSVDNKLIEAGVNFNHTFNKLHEVTGLIVVNYQDYKNKYLRGTNPSMPGEYPEIIGNTSTGTLSGSEYYSQRASVVGRAGYGYANRYFGEFSFRVDGSTRFAPENRWGFFPTISASWVISNEPFFSRVPASIMSFAKIRASAGILGDDGATSDFSYLQQYNFTHTNGYPFGGSWTQGLLPSVSSYPNRNLKWGKSKDLNAAVDVGFFNNRLSASVEWYLREQSNMVTSAETYLFPPSTGTGGVVPNVNVGRVRFTGWDITLKHENNIGDWAYDVSFNLSTTDNKVLDWGDESSITENLRHKGKNYMVWLMYQDAGLFQSQEEIDNWPVDQDGKGNRTLAPGDIKYVDQDGDNKLTTADLVYVKNSSLPDLNYGFSLGVRWKGIHLSAQFQGVAGYNQRITELYTLENGALQRFQEYHLTDTWTPENPGASYPRIKFASGDDNNRFDSTFWLKECNFLRLKTLTLGYHFPSRMLRKAHISTLDIALQGGNLFTLSSLDNMDPESLRGYPLSRSYGISLNIGF
ncbi:MAG: TonB-dependent receptor [Pseudoflavonifractor sp.]|nr:TonB-dependent receptor [Pseudoflavonifractor sp.]